MPERSSELESSKRTACCSSEIFEFAEEEEEEEIILWSPTLTTDPPVTHKFKQVASEIFSELHSQLHSPRKVAGLRLSITRTFTMEEHHAIYCMLES